MWVGAHECRYLRSQKRALDPLELKSQTVVSYLAWMLENELEPSSQPQENFRIKGN